MTPIRILIRRHRDRWNGPVMPAKFEELARYNAAVSQGIVHTPELDARMADLQREFYEWSNAQ